MLREEMLERIGTEFELIKELFDTKGREYIPGGTDDVLANFKKMADRLGMTPEQVWGIYAAKHWTSVESFIREGKVSSDEPIRGRARDLILYLLLFIGLTEESEALSHHLDRIGADVSAAISEPESLKTRESNTIECEGCCNSRYVRDSENIFYCSRTENHDGQHSWELNDSESSERSI